VFALLRKLQTLDKKGVLQVAEFVGVKSKNPDKIMFDEPCILKIIDAVGKLSSTRAIELGRLIKMDAQTLRLAEMASNSHNN